MNSERGGWGEEGSRGFVLVHTVHAAPRRGKSASGQFAKSPCQRTTQVIPRVSVMTRKARTAATKQIRDDRHGCSLPQQLFAHPLVSNTPIRVRQPLWNPQPLQ